MLVALAVVAFCYCGGKYCPKVLSSNKEVVLGVLVGMALCSFAGLKLEGFDSLNYMTCMQGAQRIMNDCRTQWEEANSTPPPPPPPPSEELRAQLAVMFQQQPSQEAPLQRLNVPTTSQSETEAQSRVMFQQQQPLNFPATPLLPLPNNP